MIEMTSVTVVTVMTVEIYMGEKRKELSLSIYRKQKAPLNSTVLYYFIGISCKTFF